MNIDRKFGPLAVNLVKGPFIGRSLGYIEVFDAQSSLPLTEYQQVLPCDCFLLKVPYANYILTWEVRLDSNEPQRGPDFVFDDEGFTAYLTPDMLSKEVPGLVNWDTQNRNSLLNVVHQLLNLFTQYQLVLLEKDGSPLSKLCPRLMEEMGLKLCQIQVLQGGTGAQLLFPESTRPPSSTISVSLLHLENQLEFERIPTKYQGISFVFTLKEYSQSSAVCFLSPSMKELLEQRWDWDIAPFKNATDIFVYTSTILSVVGDALAQASQLRDKRSYFQHGLFYELQQNSNSSVLEFDSVNFFRSSYLVENPFNTLILDVQTLRGMSIPLLTLRSSYNEVVAKIDIDSSMAWDAVHAREKVMRKIELWVDKKCIQP